MKMKMKMKMQIRMQKGFKRFKNPMSTQFVLKISKKKLGKGLAKRIIMIK